MTAQRTGIVMALACAWAFGGCGQAPPPEGEAALPPEVVWPGR